MVSVAVGKRQGSRIHRWLEGDNGPVIVISSVVRTHEMCKWSSSFSRKKITFTFADAGRREKRSLVLLSPWDFDFQEDLRILR